MKTLIAAGTSELVLRYPSLVSMLDYQVAHGTRPALVFVGFGEIGADGQPGDLEISYQDLRVEALKRAAALQREGLKPGDRVLMMLPTGPDYFYVLFGTWMAGGVPVPLAPPFRASQLERHIGHLGAVIKNSQARFFVTMPQAAGLVRLAGARSDKAPKIFDMTTFGTTTDPLATPARPAGRDSGLIQYTSGSTGAPRGVELSHQSILANLHAIGNGLQYRAGDAAVSWLPLFHDMGLFGTLSCFYYGHPMVLIPPERYMQHPAVWLQTISKYRGSVSPAPNFGYALALRRIKDRELEGVDLSSWRSILCGAEPVNPDNLRAFAERFGKFGLPSSGLMPVYGLAECTLAATFPPQDRGMVVDTIDRESFQREGRAAVSCGPDTLSFPSVGRPVLGLTVRIVDNKGRSVGPRVIGELTLRGASLMKGYFRNPKATREVLRDGWLFTGDLGYTADGEFYITGRRKDLIIRAGRNLIPQDAEAAAESVSGLRVGCTVAFGVQNPRTGTDELVIVGETRVREPERLGELKTRVRNVCLERVGSAPDVVVLLPPGSTPKTTSGKVQRSLARKQYENGTLGRKKPFWLQMLNIGMGAAAIVASRLVWQALSRRPDGAGEVEEAALASTEPEPDEIPVAEPVEV